MKLLKFAFLMGSTVVLANEHGSAYDIEVLPLDKWGWVSECNRIMLPQLLKQCNAKVVVELGVWLGEFTGFIAENIDDEAKIYAVDVWVETPECTEALQWERPKLDVFYATLYQQFLSNMIHINASHKVIPIRMSTMEAAEKLTIRPDLVYVDASHAEEDAYNDIMSWYPKIVSGGIMCGDDWGWPTVRRAVIRAAQDLHQNIHVEINFWWFDPKI